MDAQKLEKYSSAFTLSDLELFVFPDLIYSLVLANMMSPHIWEWKNDPFLQNLENATFNRKVQRLKQYIMDHYTFNLDLETWGLTTKENELNRFSKFMDVRFIAESNALFGYSGDQYYFDVDIRRHFGLDKYDSDVIPYWKTETVEAMNAFKYKENHNVGAGECVSLATLYAAALFLVLKVPLEEIFLMATPLHSQNFILKEEGILTNNRRVLTKNMWFNGTELSTKARRALEHERVTIVSHISGYVHMVYQDATIDPEAYKDFEEKLKDFLRQPLNYEIFTNFLRSHRKYQSYFQFEYFYEGKKYYITAEKLFQYEHSSKYRVGDASWKKLFHEVEMEEFKTTPYDNRDIVNVIKQALNEEKIECRDQNAFLRFSHFFKYAAQDYEMFQKLKTFICTTPRLPDKNKNYVSSPKLEIHSDMTREELFDYLKSIRGENVLVDLAFSAARYVDENNWDPYIKCCIERNPCSIDFFRNFEIPAVYETLKSFPGESIYPEKEQLAVPDEVINFKRGDGLEKAVTLGSLIKSRYPEKSLILKGASSLIELHDGASVYSFNTSKGLFFEREF